MKTKERIRPVLKAIRIALGWILIVLGGLLAGSSALCAILALFGGLETESFGEQLGLFAIFLILMCVGICVQIEGRWIKNGMFGKKQVKPAAQKVSKSDNPLSTEDQKPLEEIERNIDSVAGTIQANPMSPGRGVGEKERKNNMPLQPMDYPVPFTELLIYPNRIVKRSKAAQVLHKEETASCGTLFKETVCLYEENGRTVLVCEKQRRDEHGSQENSEWSMRAKLSMVPQPCHRIPLTKWALSLPVKDLRQYTDEVCVRTDGTPIEDNFKRYRLIKSSSMKNSHDQPGWNCTYDEIGLCFDSPDVWYLRRESHWREAPSGLPYNVTIVMKLLPGVEKKSDEELCSLLNSLPWWDPNSADRLMWDARNWLDMEWLQKLAEFNESMHRKHPHNDAYEKSLDEVLHQLCLLEEPKTAVKEKSEMKKTLTFEPALSSRLKGYRMDMHTTSGEKYSFILSGLVAFHPNQSSMCGYGCDDWLFHCTLDGEDYILNFSDEASYGRCWRCVPISREDAQRLEHLEAADWLRLMAKSGKEIHSLHPDHAAEARAAMKIDHSRCGPISDKDFYGL